MDFIYLILPALVKGAKLSVIITLQAGVLAICISIIVGIIRLSDNIIIKFITGSYVEFFRGTSAFVQIYWAYFALPMIGIKISAISAGILVLSLNVGAYGSSLSSNYNSKPLASEILVKKGKVKIIRRRQKISEII